MRFSVYQDTHVGGRKSNQDRMGYSFTRDALLLVLADGMGGHIQGEVAASLALQTIGALFQEQARPYVRRPQQFLEESLVAAHTEIHRYRAIRNLPETPRTTVVACLIQHGTVSWAHCGDSRLYWLREGRVRIRTRDHSLVENLVAQGRLEPMECSSHPDRNKLLNCLGGPAPPVVELANGSDLRSGDVILLCSDGLWAMLPDHVLAQAFEYSSVASAVPDLLQAALARGGHSSDNVTALAVRWDGETAGSAATIVTHALPAGSVTTTIQAQDCTGADSPATAGPQSDFFNDAELDKAIEEIREALERSARLNLKIRP